MKLLIITNDFLKNIYEDRLLKPWPALFNTVKT